MTEIQDLDKKLEKNFGDVMKMLKELNQTQLSISSDLKEVKTHVEKLDTAVVKAQADIATLQNDNLILQSEVAQMEQSALKKSINFFGLPPLKQEDAFAVVATFGLKIGVQMRRDDFKDIYVANHRNKTSSHIAGTVYDERKSSSLFLKIRELKRANKPVLVEDIVKLPENSTLRGTEVKVKTRLTQYTRKLLALTRLHAAQHFQFIWEADGRILIKKDKDSKLIEIKNEQQLNNILGLHNTNSDRHNASGSVMDTGH